MAKLIYLIAGEASGDLLGAGLMAALKQKDPTLKFAGIGGERMIAEGLAPLFPMAELSVMGLAEVVAHLPRLIGRINQTVADIMARKPDVVVGIDAPDFCFRVEKKIRQRDPTIKLVHYVAPSVWAWRPGRAKKIAAFLDHLLALLPFEPPYFTEVGLTCTFVGHPAVMDATASSHSRAVDDLVSGKRIVLLLPGSRKSEITRILPICLQVARSLAKDFPDLFFMIPSVPHLAPLVRDMMQDFELPYAVMDNKESKAHAFASAHAALAASGTVALELALAGVPAVITYRFSRLTGMIAHRVIRVKYASLPNLIFDREIMPEFIQENAEARLIAPTLSGLLNDTSARRMQLTATKDLPEILRPDGIDPSVQAAEVVLGLIAP